MCLAARDSDQSPLSPAALKNHLKLDELPLATTPDGRLFTMKALHPADHEIKATRMPGGNRPTVALQIDYVVDVATGGKDCRIISVPHVAVPLAMEVGFGTDSPEFWHLSNPAFGGSWTQADDLLPVTKDVCAHFERYRINGQSYTVELIAPDLANQGTVTSAQFTVESQKLALTSFTGSGTTATFTSYGKLCYVQQPPTRSDILVGTTAYTNQAREGVYVPMRLTKFRWTDVNTPHIYVETTGDVPSSPSVAGPGIMTGASGFPFYMPAKSDRTFWNGWTVPMSGNTCSVSYFQGMSSEASLRIRFRQVIEGIAYPATSFAPMALMPPQPDELSCKMYTEISQRMADGYPASYNDTGKLGSIVRAIGGKILKFVDPALDIASALPGPAGVVAAAVKQAKDAVSGKVSGTPGTVNKATVDAVIAELKRRYPGKF